MFLLYYIKIASWCAVCAVNFFSPRYQLFKLNWMSMPLLIHRKPIWLLEPHLACRIIQFRHVWPSVHVMDLRSVGVYSVESAWRARAWHGHAYNITFLQWNFYKRNLAKFVRNPRDKISRYIAKFHEMWLRFRYIFVFCKIGYHNFLATSLLWAALQRFSIFLRN